MNLLRILISVGILFYIFTQPDVNLKTLGSTFSSIPFWNLFIPLFIYGFISFLACYRWLLLLRSFDIHIGFALAVRLTLIGLFFNNMMPSLTGGDVIKGYYLAKRTPKKVEAVASILLDRIFGFSALFMLGLIASLFSFHHPLLGGLAKIIAVFVGSFFIGMILFFNRSLWRKFPGLKKFVERSSMMQGALKFYNALTALRHHKGTAIGVFLLSLFIHVMLVLANFILAKGLGMTDVYLSQFFIIIPIAGFLSAMPISFAGWGIGEGVYRALFMMINPAYGVIAVGLSIFIRLVSLGYSLLGVPFYLTYRHEPLKAVTREV